MKLYLCALLLVLKKKLRVFCDEVEQNEEKSHFHARLLLLAVFYCQTKEHRGTMR